MFRALIFFTVVAAAVWGAVTLADHPGTVSLDWGGYRVETSFAVLMGAVAAIAVAAALIYRFWIFLRRAPGQIAWAWRTKRRQRGYQALTRGMVAVAAGDADEARRQVKRADGLLDDPPLTMLVSAQAAQMNGDEKAAQGFFKAMVKEPETEFLGLRGLMTQAVKRGDTSEGLDLARRAYRLRPKSAWVAANMFQLQVRAGQWLDARVTCDDLLKRKLIDAVQAWQRKAVLSYQLSLDAATGGDREAALEHLTDANKLLPGFVPVVADLAGHWTANGRSSKAARLIEDTWAMTPHPDLVAPYWRAMDADDGLARVKATERLAARNPDHVESHVAFARASLEAQLWGEARKHLETAMAGAVPVPGRLCRMMAELEEHEHGDLGRAREWLVRASQAPADAQWVCDHCGNAVARWTAVCGKCGNFDSFAWLTPPSIQSLESPAMADAPPTPRLSLEGTDAG